jgi:hypothetical protein
MSFRIVVAPATEGVFTSIIPATPGNDLVWDTSELSAKGIIKVAMATSLNPEVNRAAIKIFPNPTCKWLFVSSDFPLYHSTASLYDQSGKSCLDPITIRENEMIFDLSGKIRGVYFLRILNENNTSVTKVVKQ